MERLTKKGHKRYVCNAPVEVCEKHRAENGTVYCCTCEQRKQMQNKLGELEDLEEQGLLLRLPCRVGDKIYFIDDGEIYWDSVNAIELRKEKGEFVFCICFMDYRKDDFGKIVFPTKAEAEKALAEMEK